MTSLPPVDDPVSACRWWATRGNPPQRHGNDPGQEAQQDTAWATLVEAIEKDPWTWLAALREVLATLDAPEMGNLGNLLALLVHASPAVEAEVISAVQDDPALLATLYHAHLGSADEWEPFAAPELQALRRLPEQALIDVFLRLSRPGRDRAGTDVWAVGLVGDIATVDPDFAWGLVRRIIAAAPEANIGMLGAGVLEDFCEAASEGFIDRIEAAAAQDDKFRTALRSVWVRAERVPEPVRQRIRAATAGEDPPLPV